LLTTDFARTVAVLTGALADPTGDVVCETLLVAHELGGSDLDCRLTALIDDRREEREARRDALARQAGARFARRFVLAVPLGMAACGLSIGNGRAAYRTGFGQAGVAAGVAMLVACWLWASRLLRLPAEPRVFGCK
jgi:tight adherence protein B